MPDSNEIKAARISLKPIRLTDAQQIANLANDWQVSRWTASLPYPYLESHAEEWITYTNSNISELVYGISTDSAICGCISCNISSGEVGYWIGRHFWGKGYASEALQALSNDIGLNYKTIVLWGACLKDNNRSARVFYNSGYRENGEVTIYGRLRHNGVPLQKFTRQLY